MNELISVDWLSVGLHFLGFSFLAIGGAVTLLPDVYRYLVDSEHWINDSQFASAIALAQASPGPNVMVLSMMGWNLGINSTPIGQSPYPLAIFGFMLILVCVLLPSSLLTFQASKWVQRHSQNYYVMGFKQGLAPIVIGAILASSWLIISGQHESPHVNMAYAVAFIAIILVWKTRIHILWMLLVGALLGGLSVI
ncbi:MAG: chromate transporter [Betaproteobacteria bacterium]